MSDLGTSIRRLVDETAPPIDGMQIVNRSDRRTARPGWVIGVATGFAALAVGLLTLAVLGWEPLQVPPVSPGSGTTGVSETTVGNIPSTTSAADAEAAARAAEEARRRALQEVARQAASRQVPYLGISLPGWEFSRAGETQWECGNQPDPLLGVRQATYVAPEAQGRTLSVIVVSRYAMCPSDEIATDASDLGPRPMAPGVIDHGMTTVMGHEARIVESDGVYQVLWLLDDPGSYASIIVDPGVTPLTVEEVLAITQGVVELTGDQWAARVAGEFSWPTAWSEALGHSVAGRTFPTIVWTGSEYVVWGGEKPSEGEWHKTGAAFSPTLGRWRDLAPSPLAPRSEHAAVWTGTEVLICCGRQVGPGASAGAYQPATDAWRTIPQPPISPNFAEAVWTGTEMIVFGGVGPGGFGNLRGAAAYNPATDIWRTLADLPYGIEREAEAVLAEGVIYAWPSAGRPGDDAAPLAYDIGNDTWQVLAVPSELTLPLSPSLVWTGSELIAWGLARDFERNIGVGVALEPTTGTWRSLPPTPLPATSPSEGSQGSQGAVWAGTQMIVWTGWIGSEWDGPTTAVLAYDPAADSWSHIEPAPVRAAGLWQHPLIWTGTQLIVHLPGEDTVLVYTPESMPPLG